MNWEPDKAPALAPLEPSSESRVLGSQKTSIFCPPTPLTSPGAAGPAAQRASLRGPVTSGPVSYAPDCYCVRGRAG